MLAVYYAKFFLPYLGVVVPYGCCRVSTSRYILLPLHCLFRVVANKLLDRNEYGLAGYGYVFEKSSFRLGFWLHINREKHESNRQREALESSCLWFGVFRVRVRVRLRVRIRARIRIRARVRIRARIRARARVKVRARTRYWLY